jgi:hypothetical protein
LENARAESCSLARARLCLLDDIQTHCKWHNTTLLDGRRLVKTICIDASKKILM